MWTPAAEHAYTYADTAAHMHSSLFSQEQLSYMQFCDDTQRKSTNITFFFFFYLQVKAEIINTLDVKSEIPFFETLGCAVLFLHKRVSRLTSLYFFGLMTE